MMAVWWCVCVRAYHGFYLPLFTPIVCVVHWNIHVTLYQYGCSSMDVEGGDQRRDDLYACKVRTEIQSVIDYFSSNFCFLADDVLRKVAGD